MFYDNANQSFSGDSAYSFWSRWHRLAGYVLPPNVFIAAEALFTASQSKPESTRLSAANVQLATALLRQALVFYPFDRRLLDYVQRLHALAPSTGGFDVWIRTLQHMYRRRPDHFVDSIAVSGQIRSEIPDIFFNHLPEGQNPGLICTVLHDLWSTGRWESVREILLRMMALPAAPFLAPLAAWSAWNAGEKDLATRWLSACVPATFLTYNLLAELAIEAGDKENARRHWSQSLEWEPYQPHLFYRYWESRKCSKLMAAGKSKKIHIALYTYNKLEPTLATLKSLLSSGIETCPVTILNNGSTSFSKVDLNLGVRAVAQGRPVNIIHLPVNIGAPAARNWLWHLDQVKSCDYVAFLDDDVLVPAGWLDLYIETLELFPHAVVVGPRVLNPGTLPTIQYVHRFFHQVGDHKILFTPAAPMIHDVGQFSYRHPCLSVMGCCHLFHRHRWEKLGIPDFDICFAPSQVDDLEHDLQIWKRGGQVIYDGRVAVIHLQEAGRASSNSRAAWGHVWGNHLKMESKFTEEELIEIQRRVENADDAFHKQVIKEVKEELYGKGSA